MSVVYLNGQFIQDVQATIPITDRGFLFGDGIFTTLKVDDGQIYHLDNHLERVTWQCEKLNIRMPKINREVFQEIVKRNGAYEGIWRMKLIITGGGLPDLSLPLRDPGSVLISIKETHQPITTPAKLVIYPESIQSPISQLKTLSYLERLYVKQYAKEKGADDALVLSHEGYILEAAFSNILWIDDGHFFTPKSSLPILQGITLQKHIEKAKAQGMSVHEDSYLLEDISDTASIYLCNAITEKRPVELIC